MSSSTFSSSTVLNTYGLAAVVLIAMHLGFASSDTVWSELYRLSVPSRDDALRLEANLRSASTDGRAGAILLIGSSQTREDFEIEYLNQRFRDRTRFINLGVSGNGNPVEMYMLTPRIVEARPKLVIYMPFIGSLFRPYNYSTFDLYFDPTIIPLIRSHYGSGELIDRADVITMGLLRRGSILFRHRNTLQHLIDDGVRRWITDSPSKTAQTFAYHERKPDTHFKRLIETHRKRPRYREHRYRPLYEAAFHEMARTLREENIPLLVVDGPTHPLIRHFYDQRLNSVYHEFFSQASKTHGFSYLPMSELPRFDDGDFNDFTHLNAEGRARFNEFIAHYLQTNAARVGLTDE